MSAEEKINRTLEVANSWLSKTSHPIQMKKKKIIIIIKKKKRPNNLGSLALKYC